MSSTWPCFGAFSYGFGADRIDDLIEQFSAMGLTGVQWGADLLDASIGNPDGIPATVAKLRQAEIEIVGIAGYRNLVAPDPARRRAGIDDLKRCIEVAPQLGTNVVATETGTRNPADWQPHPDNLTAEVRALVFDALDQLLPVAEAHGVVLALETYVNNVIRTLDDIDDLLRRYPSPSLGLVLDPFNLISVDLLPDAERVGQEFCTRYVDRFAIAHLKDVSALGAESDTPAFGDGVFPFAHLKAFLRDQRPDLVVVLEHIDVERIPAAIARFRALEA